MKDHWRALLFIVPCCVTHRAHDDGKRIWIFKRMKKCSSYMAHNKLLEFIVGGCCYSTHFNKIQISEDLPVLRSRAGTPGLSVVAEIYFPCGIMLHSLPIANRLLSFPLKYELLSKITRLVHNSFWGEKHPMSVDYWMKENLRERFPA